MGRGILFGAFWGAIVGALVLAVLSLYAPPPPESARIAPEVVGEVASVPDAEAPVVAEVDDAAQTAVEITESTPEVEQPQTAEVAAEEPVEEVVTEETAAVSGETASAEEIVEADVETPQVEDSAVAETTPEPEAPVTAPEVTAQLSELTDSAQVDEDAAASIAEQAASAINKTLPASPEAQNTSPDPVTVETEPARLPEVAVEIDDAPAIPSENAGSVVSQEQVAAAVTTPATQALTAPTASDASPAAVESPAAPVETPKPEAVAEAEATTTSQEAEPQQLTRLQIPQIEATPEVSQTQAETDLPQATEQAVAGVVVNRLPTVTSPQTETVPETEDTEDVGQITSLDPADVGALKAFGGAVEVASGQSLFSIILIDTGADGLPRDELAALNFPVTIALDPVAPNAAEAMRAYRAAGLEVVAMPEDLPTAAAPGDVEVAIAGYFGVMNEAVAILDPLDGRIQSNRSLLQPVLGAIRASGHGLITYNRGLNSAVKAAQREDIPAATVFRVLDADLESAETIKRYLDRAAFTAGKDGSVVVVGRSYPDTVQAILEWATDDKGSNLALVPVSTVMLSEGGA